MKEAELRAAATCALCNHSIGKSGLPLFWRVRIERLGIDLQAVRRRDGLAAFLGSSALASAMDIDADVTIPAMEPIDLTVCETCAMEKVPNLIAAAMEKSEGQAHVAG